MDNILPFITPGPMKERFKFSTRVFISWISLGLFLGLMFGIGWSIAGMSQAITAFFVYLIALPILTCSFGLIGLGIDSMQKRSSYYKGWYWWLFPITSYVFVGFWLTFGLLFLAFSFMLTIMGINLPQSKRGKEIKQKQSQDFLDEYGDKLKQMQQQEMERLRKEQLEGQKKKELLESLSIRERILLKIEENPMASLEDILTEEEMDELIEMILEMII